MLVAHGRRELIAAVGSAAIVWPFTARAQVPDELELSNSASQRSILISSGTDAHALTDIEYEIEPAVEVVASVRHPHQQFGLE